MPLPPDLHVHTEWSWDAQCGSMEKSCAEAVRLGLPAIAFTEHLDHTVWTVAHEGLAELPRDHPVAMLSDADGRVAPPAFDVTGYLDAVERCRRVFPELVILSGLEIGEPHWHSDAVHAILASGTFDRVLGSLHCLPEGDGFQEPGDLFTHRDPGEVVRDYLAEVARLVAHDESFSVLGHVDYPARSWPTALGSFDPWAFEEEFRHALRATRRQAGHWRSTPSSPSRPPSCGGGTKRAAMPSPSAATPTSRPTWHAASRKQRLWRRPTDSAPPPTSCSLGPAVDRQRHRLMSGTDCSPGARRR